MSGICYIKNTWILRSIRNVIVTMVHRTENISPQPLYSLVVGRGTYPLACTNASHTRTFSTPLSTRILEGQRFPSLCTAARKSSRIVSAKLLELHCRETVRLENPSMHPCVTIFHLIKEWWPSKCHSEFGQGTWYVRRETTTHHLNAVFWGVNSSNTLSYSPSLNP